MSLPNFMVLKSVYNRKYLRYIHEDGEGIKGYLQFSGEEVLSPYAKYKVEMAKSGNPGAGLVHIRCCYNNKYWVRLSINSNWVVAEADEPEEDQSKWSCTLFEPLYTDDDDDDDKAIAANKNVNTVRFRHVQLGCYACLWRTGPPTASCLYLGSKSPDRDLCHVYKIIDWESLVILPKLITFKGNNGLYLKALDNGTLQFSATRRNDPAAGFEIFTTSDGNIFIKSDSAGRFWNSGSHSWIAADTTNTTGNPHTLFSPITIDNTTNAIALRSLGTNYICQRFTSAATVNGLFPNISNSNIPTPEARLEVEEL